MIGCNRRGVDMSKEESVDLYEGGGLLSREIMEAEQEEQRTGTFHFRENSSKVVLFHPVSSMNST